MTDNQTVSFFYIDTKIQVNDAMYATRQRLDPTSLNTTYAASAGPNVDVLARDKYYTDWCELELGFQWTANGTTGLFGLTNCESLVSAGRCQQQTVRLSDYYIDVWNAAGDEWLACHETGHAIGLSHRILSPARGCMQNGNGIPVSPEYMPHDVAHFNNWSNSAS
jgi:hypothetical protein